jgi:hypothetical protein
MVEIRLAINSNLSTFPFLKIQQIDIVNKKYFTTRIWIVDSKTIKKSDNMLDKITFLNLRI